MIDVPLLFCVICREPVPAERVVRGAITCDKKHAQMKKKMMRDFKASKVCQTCGRPARKRRESLNVSLVPSLHSEATVLGADANIPTIDESFAASARWK